MIHKEHIIKQLRTRSKEVYLQKVADVGLFLFHKLVLFRCWKEQNWNACMSLPAMPAANLIHMHNIICLNNCTEHEVAHMSSFMPNAVIHKR